MTIELRHSSRTCGGLGIKSGKSLDKSCLVVKYDDESRIRSLKVDDNTRCRNLFLNVYFLYEHSDYYDEYMGYLHKLCNIIGNYKTPYV
jgi:hypothetical protein